MRKIGKGDEEEVWFTRLHRQDLKNDFLTWSKEKLSFKGMEGNTLNRLIIQIIKYPQEEEESFALYPVYFKT